MKIRSVQLSDAKAIASIYKHYVLHTPISFEIEAVSEAEMRSRISHIAARWPFLVCEDELGQLVGYCYAHEWKERKAYAQTLELTIYMKPDCCGKQLGASLMNQLIAECKEKGFSVLIACITAENKQSCSFFESLGFKRVSYFEKVGYKFDRYWDVVDYQLTLK
ncbi:MAG: GNAT family N-acetyltransferase [Akkermansia sp.]|nr:GNAT family N-acetyltransferase [Akkermansia sp.]